MAEERHSLDVLDNEAKIFAARREALNAQISLLNTQLAQLDAQVAGFDDQVKAEQAIIGTLNEELRAKRQLYNERYLEKSQILELERTLASHQATGAASNSPLPRPNSGPPSCICASRT